MCADLSPPTESLSTTRFAGLSVAGFFALVRDEIAPVHRAGRQRGHLSDEPALPATALSRKVGHVAGSAAATNACGTNS
jgi:hypothetical protein